MSTVPALQVTPFKGLTPFGASELDALFFFGREREREIVVANLLASRLTVLYGPSGVGKTSLLGAGVAYALQGLPDAVVVVSSSWVGNPVKVVRNEIEEAVGLTANDDTLVGLLVAAAEAADSDIYVILDQFEEYFLYHGHERGPRSFAAQFAEAVRRPGLRANFLIGIREDALAQLDSFKALIPGLLGNSLRLDRLDRAAGEAAIVGPVNAYNGLVPSAERQEVEPALITGVLAQVAAGRVDLGRSGRGTVDGANGTDRIEAPYLQLVLERLWEVETGEGSHRLRLDTLTRLGGATRIVEDHLERAMAGLSAREQDAAAAMYNHLVTPSGMKIAHGVSDLAGYAAVGEDEAAAVLRRLSDERIVRAGENGGAGRYEIFHDVLADAVLAWRTRHDADRRLEEQRRESDKRHRRMLLLVAGTLGALCIVAALAVYAVVQRTDARHQAARANAQRLVAVRKTHDAERSKADALHQRNNARREQRRANRAREEAKHQAANAKTQQAKAEHQKVVAEQAKNAADVAKRQAQANAANARSEATRANNASSQARKSAALAVQQRKIAHARQLAADAKALLVEDTQKSVQTSLVATASFRAVGMSPPRAVEDTLREGLVNLRVEAVLSGVGIVHTTTFSPDGSLLLVAGDGGARIFDRTRKFASRPLLPATNLLTAKFSPDGRLVAGGGGRSDHSVRVWDVRSGALLYTLPHNDATRDVAFSPDGRVLATAGADGYARLWSLAGGLELLPALWHPPGTVPTRAGVWAVSFSPDGKRLLTVGGDRFARVWDVQTHKLLFQLNCIGFVNSARFSHDGRLIATADNDPIVRVWDAQTGDPRYQFLQASGVNDVAFSPDDKFLATAGGLDALARVWRLGDGSVTAMLTLHLAGVEEVAFTPDGGSIISRGRDRNVYMWAANGGFLQASLIGHSGPINDVSVSPDGRVVVTGGDDHTTRVWDARVNKAGPFPPAFSQEVGDHGLAVNEVEFSPDGRVILSAGADGTARLWEPGKSVIVLKHDGGVTDGSFSHDGNLVITASADGTARIWRAADGTLLMTLRHGAPLSVAQLSPNGRLAVTAGADGRALLWDAHRGVILHRLVHSDAIEDARFSPDGTRLVTASDDDTAAVWNVADGKRIATLAGHTANVVAAAFSPDGRRVATASADSTARIWNAATGGSEYELLGHTLPLTSLAFSPNSRLLATSSLDRDVRIWNVRSGKQVALLRIHVGRAADVAFSRDGRWLATAGSEAAGIWETKGTGQWPSLPLYLVRLSPRLTTIAFSPHGWRIATGSHDGPVRTFDCKVCGRITELKALAHKRLAAIVRRGL